jgi:hypothetical protein
VLHNYWKRQTIEKMKTVVSSILLLQIWNHPVLVVDGFAIREGRGRSLACSHSRVLLKATTTTIGTKEEEVDVIVIGAGLGGLSCAALSSKYGLKTLCLEAHDTPGGCAHSFDRYSTASTTIPFQFDSGPSLISGCSSKSKNPLRQVLDAVGTANDIEWKNYDGWVVHDLADGKALKVTTGSGGEFEAAIQAKAGLESRKAFETFKAEILSNGGLAEVSAYIPPFALRGGAATLLSLSRYFLKLIQIGPKGLLLTGPFSDIMDQAKVSRLSHPIVSISHLIARKKLSKQSSVSNPLFIGLFFL